ncbi:MAG: hypothetical protein CL822_00540 [Crocinitomicaceae bacterium]|nr:hypothetical protein [Crocinitomicaceae bacterium]
MKTTLTLLLASMSLSVLGQTQLYVLNEGRFDWNNGVIDEAPSLGVIDLATSSYAQIASFDSIAFATDLEVQGGHGYICLENTVMKVNLITGEVLHEVMLEGAQELALLDGMLYVTRGGVDPATWGPLDLESHLAWLNSDDLSFEGELTLTSGPQYACQAICVHNGQVVVGVNNGWVWGGEVGLVGTYDPASGLYTEVDLGEAGKNPVALHEVDGAVLSVNNGDWSSTSVSRVVAGETLDVSTEVLADVAAGCNASAVVSANRLALQIDQEAGLRLVDGATGLGTGETLNPSASSAYSLAVHPSSDMTFSGVTDFVSEGHVEMHDDLGNLVGSVQVGIAPGTLVWGETATDNLNDIMRANVAWPAGTYDLQGRAMAPHQASPGQVLLHVDSRGTVTKEVVVRMD